jgi:hypothetical protein
VSVYTSSVIPTELPPCGRVIKGLTVTQLVTKFPPFMKPEGPLPYHMGLKLEPNLSEMNAAYTLTTHYFYIQLTLLTPERINLQETSSNAHPQ